nr:immunoglobulin light chain junction region [Macaca mulatta]
CHQYSSLPYTF